MHTYDKYILKNAFCWIVGIAFFKQMLTIMTLFSTIKPKLWFKSIVSKLHVLHVTNIANFVYSFFTELLFPPRSKQITLV